MVAVSLKKSPEGFASILWKDSKRAGEAAECMKITAEELKELGVVEKVLEEKTPVTKDNCLDMCQKIRQGIIAFLEKYKDKSEESIIEERYQRFRKF